MNINQADQRKHKVYRIISKKSGLQMAVSTDPQTTGVLVLQPHSNYLTNQFILEDHKKFYIIKSQLTQQCISVLHASCQPGAVMVTLPNYNKQHQRLYLTKCHLKNEYIVSTFSGLVLDCYQEGDKDGTLIVQWPQSGKNHQKWIFQQIGA